MSVRATTWAYEAIEGRDMTAKAAAVLVALAWLHHQETGRCSPSVARLVQRTKLSERAVRLALRELEALKLIVTTHRTERTGRGKRNMTSFYRFRMPSQGGAPRAGGVGHHVPGERAKKAHVSGGGEIGHSLPSSFYDLIADPDDDEPAIPIQKDGHGGER